MKKLLYLFLALTVACSDDDGNPCTYDATLTTSEATNVTNTSATLNGTVNVVSQNCDDPNNAEQGFVISTEIQPTINDTQINVNGTNISTIIEDLEPNTTYYVRSFLTNFLGEFYGNEISFTTYDGFCNNGDVVYLADNGITIKACPDAQVGESGEVNGVTYTIVDENELRRRINSGENFENVCTSQVTSMYILFSYFDFNNSDYIISSWDVSNVTDMRGIFEYSYFNQDISNWDMGNVTDMTWMFYASPIFNSNIGNWDVSNVELMESMFYGNSQFSISLNDWDVSNVQSMAGMFNNTNYNQDLSNWDVGNVTNMNCMFCSSRFNQDISNWNVSNVTRMQGMFISNPVFNQDLSSWDVSNVIDCSQFSENTPQWTLPKPNFPNCTP
jgi:surface protein